MLLNSLSSLPLGLPLAALANVYIPCIDFLKHDFHGLRKKKDRKKKEDRIKKRDEARNIIFIAGGGNRKLIVLKFSKLCPLVLQSKTFCPEDIKVMGSGRFERATRKLSI
jgi:hypothetical protein